MDVCPVCQYSEKRSTSREEVCMTEFVNVDTKEVSVFNTTKKELSFPDGASKGKWVRKVDYTAPVVSVSKTPIVTSITPATPPNK